MAARFGVPKLDGAALRAGSKDAAVRRKGYSPDIVTAVGTRRHRGDPGETVPDADDIVISRGIDAPSVGKKADAVHLGADVDFKHRHASHSVPKPYGLVPGT